MVTEGSK